MKNKTLIHVKKDITPFFNYENFEEEEWLNIRLMVNSSDVEIVTKEIDKAFDNWSYDYCENSIIKGFSEGELCSIPIGDYILMWLDELKINVFQVDE